MGKKVKDYNIGLDIGTNSVGWCVTDVDNNLLKFKNKNMWGVRLFEEGKTAAETRVKRGQRRRYMRRKQRIHLLQEMIGPMVLQKDKTFFIRLEDSFLWREDKRLHNDYILFADKDYCDKDYYDKYPTIYHLRDHLINTTEKVDSRLIYLAIHHIIKYRGNFLYERQGFETSKNDYNTNLIHLCESMSQWTGLTLKNPKVIEDVAHLLQDKQLHKKDKQETVIKHFVSTGVDKKIITEVVKAILGYKFDIAKLFEDRDLINEEGKNIVIGFSDVKYEEQIEILQNALQERYQIIEQLHQLYSQYVLNDILLGKQYISEAMVVRYKKHHQDLQVLKKLIKIYAKDRYNEFFRQEKDTSKKTIKNYVNYIKGDKDCNQEDLYKSIRAILKEVPIEDRDCSYCIQEIEDYKFLLRLNSRLNNSIPYQMNETELRIIFNNQEKYYPEIAGHKEKIMSLLSFRIPYYIGPLNPNSRFAWLKRSNEKIYPWNFKKIVDEDSSAEAFITNMTNYCTYLPEEKVIPKHSLLYSKFTLLDELNGIRINQKKITKEDKYRIINDLFMHTKKVTNNKLCQWLIKEQYAGCLEYEVTGYQKENEFASSLSSYLDFSKIFGKVDTSNECMIEDIIYWLTIFEEKTIVERKILQKYREQISEYQIKKILKLRYQGWARLSKKLLVELTVKENEQSHNIIYYLQNTTMKFKQIITSKDLGFAKQIEEKQQILQGKSITQEEIKKLQGSPAIKKAVWQTIKLIEEVCKIVGKDPQHIFIEFARSDENSKRTQSRKNKLQDAYNNLAQEVLEYNQQVAKELKDKKYIEQLKDERLYLYFIQNGKCMYTGHPLEIDSLHLYEVDHIIPQCYIKDDSLENKVLVFSIENQRKLDNLLLKEEVQIRNQIWWEKLYKHGLVGAKKYHNLTRRGFSEQEQQGFINRQLVETRQISKHVAVLLQDSYVNTRIVVIKAELSHHFRVKYHLYKSRTINDYHHAQDAYLANIIGNTLLLNKDTDGAEWIYNQYVIKYKKKGLNRENKFGYVISLFDNEVINEDGIIVWDGKKDIEKTIKIFNYKDCSITKKLEENTGKFYDETIYSHDSGKTLVPIKEGLDVLKYGGYSGVNNAYSVVIECKKKKGREKVLVGMPIQIAYSINQGKLTLLQYLNKIGYEEVKILREKVLKYQLIEESGNLEYITSAQEVCNARQLILDRIMQQIIYQINNPKINREETFVTNVDKIYAEIMDKIRKHYKLFIPTIDKLGKTVIYNQLNTDKKITLILELLRMTKADAQNANLKKINNKLSERAGRKNSYTINIDKTYFIDQSITGLYERRSKL